MTCVTGRPLTLVLAIVVVVLLLHLVAEFVHHQVDLGVVGLLLCLFQEYPELDQPVRAPRGRASASPATSVELVHAYFSIS